MFTPNTAQAIRLFGFLTKRSNSDPSFQWKPARVIGSKIEFRSGESFDWTGNVTADGGFPPDMLAAINQFLVEDKITMSPEEQAKRKADFQKRIQAELDGLNNKIE